jgi:GT2 family glycosyltransferase
MKKNIFSVSIIIPNWNGKELLKKHLSSVIESSNGAAIILADDCSDDDSISYVQNNFPTISIIKTKRHEGFASAVNAGVQRAKTEIVVLLNTDIEPEKEFLQPLLTHFTDPKVFAVGCMDKSSEKGEIVLRGRGIGWWKKGFFIHKRGEVNESDTAWVSGGSGAFRRSIWNELGGMDRVFNPFYWEDIDISQRAIEKGYRILFDKQSIVYHYHESGVIASRYSQNQIKMIAFRNQFYFVWKHIPLGYFSVHVFWTGIRLLQSIGKREQNFIQGYVHALLHAPTIFYRRFFNIV